MHVDAPPQIAKGKEEDHDESGVDIEGNLMFVIALVDKQHSKEGKDGCDEQGVEDLPFCVPIYQGVNGFHGKQAREEPQGSMESARVSHPKEGTDHRFPDLVQMSGKWLRIPQQKQDHDDKTQGGKTEIGDHDRMGSGLDELLDVRILDVVVDIS
jgi:hypothetical protein